MTTTLSAANSGNPNGGSETQIWTICPVCGQSYKQGESHVCTFSPAATTTGQDYWTCSGCGQRVPYGELHVCGGRDDSGTWPPASPPHATWPPNPQRPFDGWPYDSNGTIAKPSLEERRVRALERIAAALEKLAK